MLMKQFTNLLGLPIIESVTLFAHAMCGKIIANYKWIVRLIEKFVV